MNRIFKLILVSCSSFVLVAGLQGQTPAKFYAVQVSATVQTSPPRINLSWPGDTNATSYAVYRKAQSATTWNLLGNLAGNATSYSDSALTVGSAFEYKIEKQTSASYFGYGYIFAGINAPLNDTHGTLILIVENTYSSDMAAELIRLQQDLTGDGWTVIRHDVSRFDSPASVKALIVSDYNRDPANVRSLFLFGRVPVPYSGNIMPDGHPNHQGAWPADTYYGDMTGTWTDSSVNTTTAENSRNWNVPGDGKFDQSEPPGEIKLQIGRVDLANMTCFSNKTPSRSERDLLRQYLNKDHNFRHRVFNLQRRAYLSDNFVDTGKDPVACSGWRNFSAFFGANNIGEFGPNNYFPTLTRNSYLWSYSAGGGQYYTSYGTGSSDDFATNDVQVVFTLFMGSYFGDWDAESDLLRAPLGSTSYALTCTYAGAPHSLYHHMALGENIGYGIRLTQNNISNGTYFPQQGSHKVHIALMGDPTLRLHPVLPVANLAANTSSGVALSWSPSGDSAIQGYHVYRAPSAAGPFTRLTSSPVTGTSFSDSPGSGTFTYMVRAIKLEQSGSGTYYNPSQGIFITVNASGGTITTPPAAPSSLAATAGGVAQITLTWGDGANNETGYKIERKTGAGGTYAQISTVGVNVTAFTDTGLAAGTQYFYRVRAYNTAGDSAFSNEASATTAAPQPITAVVSFVETDSTHQGTWRSTYGTEGYYVIGGDSSMPTYAGLTGNGNSFFVWADPTTDVRALQRGGTSTDRVAGCFYSAGSFSLRLNLTDGQTHRVALYFVDWDLSGRSATVTVSDTGAGAILNSQSISAFGQGKFLVWDIKGDVTFNFTNVTGDNAVVSGLFLGLPTPPPPPPPLQAVTLGSPALSGGFHCQLTGQDGQQFVIDVSPDCIVWTPLQTNTFNGGVFNFNDPQPANVGGRYFRVRTVR